LLGAPNRLQGRINGEAVAAYGGVVGKKAILMRKEMASVDGLLWIIDLLMTRTTALTYLIRQTPIIIKCTAILARCVQRTTFTPEPRSITNQTNWKMYNSFEKLPSKNFKSILIRLSAWTMLTGKFEIYHQRFIFVIA
jgi:hypothetical protein